MSTKNITKSTLSLIVALLFILSITVILTSSGVDLFELRSKAGTTNEATVRAWEFNGSNSEGWLGGNDPSSPLKPPVSRGYLLLTNQYLPLTYNTKAFLTIKKDTKIKIYLSVNEPVFDINNPRPTSTPNFLPFTGSFEVRYEGQREPQALLSFQGTMNNQFSDYEVTLPDSLIEKKLTGLTLYLSGPSDKGSARVDWIHLTQPASKSPDQVVPTSSPCNSNLQSDCLDKKRKPNLD